MTFFLKNILKILFFIAESAKIAMNNSPVKVDHEVTTTPIGGSLLPHNNLHMIDFLD